MDAASIKIIASIISATALLYIAYKARKNSRDMNLLNIKHSEALAFLNHSFTKEAHASSHLYTRKAILLEQLSEKIGEVSYWAETLVVARTHLDLGNKKEIADRMAKAFEDLILISKQYRFAYCSIPDLYNNLGKLMGSVNTLTNVIANRNPKADTEEWRHAADHLMTELNPVINSIQSSISDLINVQQKSIIRKTL